MGTSVGATARWWLGVMLITALLSSCTNRCEAELLVPVAAAGSLATSCPEQFELDGRAYDPWCATVRGDLVGSVLGSNRSGEAHALAVARKIDGVPVEDAIALRRPWAAECGTWTFSPYAGMDLPTAKRLARAVTY